MSANSDFARFLRMSVYEKYDNLKMYLDKFRADSLSLGHSSEFADKIFLSLCAWMLKENKEGITDNIVDFIGKRILNLNKADFISKLIEYDDQSFRYIVKSYCDEAVERFGVFNSLYYVAVILACSDNVITGNEEGILYELFKDTTSV